MEARFHPRHDVQSAGEEASELSAPVRLAGSRPEPTDSLGSGARWLFGLALCALLFAYYGYFIQWPGPNELSRYDLALALVREHTTKIDAYEVNTIDEARFGGAHYTDKAIGTSLLAVSAIWALERFQHLGDYGSFSARYPIHVATRLAVSLPAALAAWMLYRLLRRAGTPAADALLATAALALGSAYAVFAAHLFGHSAAAGFGLLAAGPVFFRKAGWRGWLLAGGLAGLAVLVEYPAAIIAAAIGLVALVRSAEAWRDPEAGLGERTWRAGSVVGTQGVGGWAWRLARLPVVTYAVGALAALLPLGIYNLVSFGSPFALGYGYVDDPAFAGAKQGLFGITVPSLAALGEITFGPAGLFTQSPYLLLGLPGFAIWLWRGRFRLEGAAALAIVAAFFYVNAGYYLPMGGQSLGPRFLIPALPFLALAIAFVPRWLRWLGLPLVAYSVANTLGIIAVFPKADAGLPDAFRAYWLPHLALGDLATNWGELRFALHDARSLLPLAALAGLALAGLLLAGAAGWLARRQSPARSGWVTSTIAGGYAIVAIAGALYLTAPVDLTHPSRPPDQFALLVPGRIPEQPLSIRYGDLFELVGYQAPESLAPGEALRLTLYWRKLRPTGTRYSMYVHLFGRAGEKLGGFDAVPDDGAYPAEAWPIGVVVRDTYTVRVAAQALIPTALRVRVGVYESGVLKQLPATDSRGTSLGDGPVALQLRLGQQTIPIATADLKARFGIPGAGGEEAGDVIGLAGWALPSAAARPGDEVAGTLTWRALKRPTTDYTVFVQAIGPTGPVAQWDSQPVGGDYPTSLWRPGEEVADSFRLAVGSGVAPGTYTVIAGLYDLKTMARLRVGADDFVRIGEVRVEK